MSYELKMPQPGMGINECTVLKWHKALGQQVTRGEVLLEIETAKSVVEVQSPVTGMLEAILLAEGVTAEVNTTIALLRE